MLLIYILLSLKITGNDSANFYTGSDTELHSLEHWKISFPARDTVTGKKWLPYYSNELDADYKGIREFRTKIILDNSYKYQDQLGLYFISSFSAYEIYWNGNLIGKNGKISDQDESPGNFVSILQIPGKMTKKGEHELRIRLSNNSYKKSLSLNASYLGKLSVIRAIENRESFRLGFTSSLYFIAAFLCLILYQSGEKFKPYLTFAGFCFLALFLSMCELAMYHYYINNRYINSIDMAFYIIYPLKYLLLYIFVSGFFKIKTAPLLFLILFIIFYYINTAFAYYFALISCLAVSVYAYILKKKYSLPMFIGLSVYLSLTIFSRLKLIPHEYSFAVLALILTVFYLIAALAKDLKEEKERTALKASRIETELLKKTIQPHFINNTLLSIISWIKKEPNVAVDMVHALSEEFDLIISFSKKTVIKIEDELRLCQKHLFIMSQRKEQKFKLEISNRAGDFTLPPLILHTLIENTVSYLPQEAAIIRISLEIRKNSSGISIELKSPTYKKQNLVRDGMGYTYIKSRLSEVYGSSWKFEHLPAESHWLEKIWIANEKNTNS